MRSKEYRKNLSDSIKEGYKNGRTTWNKGLTKETDPRVQKQADTYSKTHKDFKGENNPFYGKKHSAETKRQLSILKGGTGIARECTEYGVEFTTL